MKKVFILLLLLFSMLNLAEAARIKGVIRDENKDPLIGVQIQIENTGIGTVTDINGEFFLESDSLFSKSIICFTYIGMATERVLVGKQERIDLIMREEAQLLNEIVAIGYGTMRKKDLTGAIENVDMRDVVNSPVVSMDQAIAGRIAGVQISANDGQPGQVLDVVIRGGNSLTQSNTPLYVIDGFAMEDNVNMDIDPADIESISVLKDASATAIYGARAANGVIVIRTKQGQTGKPVINFKISAGFQQILKTMELMDSYEFVKYQLELNPEKAQDAYLSDGKGLEDYRGVKGYDWQDQAFHLAPLQNYSLSVRGGHDDIHYSVFGSITDQQGIIINSGFRRYQGKVALDFKLSDFCKVGITTLVSYNQNYGQIASDTRGEATSALMYSIWGYRPVTGKEDYASLIEGLTDPEIDSSSDYRVNPIVNLNNEQRKKNTFFVKPDAFVQFEIIKNLKLKLAGGIYKRDIRDEAFYNSNTSRGTSTIPSNSARLVNGSIKESHTFTWNNENTLSYSAKIKKYHALSAMIGTTLQGQRRTIYGLGAFMLPNESLGLSGLDEGTPSTNVAEQSENRLLSFFTRLTYNYHSRYYATLTFRADGSSKFAPRYKWGYFPSAALAWRMSEEKWMKQQDVVTNLKFRASYGLTGNNRVSDFAYLPQISFPLAADYSFNNATPTAGATLDEMGNSDLKWETTYQADLGVDIGLWDRVNLTVDWYSKRTKDLLQYANLPYESGFTNVYRNIGEISNTGCEISLNTINIKTMHFRWESSFNISFNFNKIISLTSSDEIYSYINWHTSYSKTPLYVSKVGGPMSQFYGYQFDGIYQVEDFTVNSKGDYVLRNDLPDNGTPRNTIQPGDIRFRDLNGDNAITAEDRTVIGNPYPKHIGGFNNILSYKGFSLAFFFQWSYGNQVFNANRIFFEGNATNKYGLNQFASYVDRWTEKNRSNTLYRTGGGGPSGAYSSREIEDASYLRLKNLAFAYSFREDWIHKVRMKELKLQFSVQNVFTVTRYSGMDPEVSVHNSNLTPGFDYSAYPKARTYMFELNVSF